MDFYRLQVFLHRSQRTIEAAPLPELSRFRRPWLSEIIERVATVTAFLTVGFCRWKKPTVNHRAIDRGYGLSSLGKSSVGKAAN